MPRKHDPSDAIKVMLFRDSMYYEIIHTFGVPATLTDEQLDEHAIGETVNFTRYAHARLLSHFLYRIPTDKISRDDDAFASDYGFDIRKLYPNENDRNDKSQHMPANKGILHLTYRRVNESTLKPWGLSNVLSELLPDVIRFMEHIQNNNIVSLNYNLFDNDQEKSDWAYLHECLMICRDKQGRLRYKSGFQGDKSWYSIFTQPGDITVCYGAKEVGAPNESHRIATRTNTTALLSMPGELVNYGFNCE